MPFDRKCYCITALHYQVGISQGWEIDRCNFEILSTLMIIFMQSPECPLPTFLFHDLFSSQGGRWWWGLSLSSCSCAHFRRWAMCSLFLAEISKLWPKIAKSTIFRLKPRTPSCHGLADWRCLSRRWGQLVSIALIFASLEQNFCFFHFIFAISQKKISFKSLPVITEIIINKHQKLLFLRYGPHFWMTHEIILVLYNFAHIASSQYLFLMLLFLLF